MELYSGTADAIWTRSALMTMKSFVKMHFTNRTHEIMHGGAEPPTREKKLTKMK